MDYDFRNRTAPSYRPPSAPASMYPRVGGGQPVPHPGGRATAVPPPPLHHPSSSAAPSGYGIKVMIKPEYRVTPPPQLSPQTAEVPRSTFQFDFDFEKKILALAEKENPNWSALAMQYQQPKIPALASSSSSRDPVVSKYVSMGLDLEAVTLAVKHYGDNPAKVREFVKEFGVLREMGFSPNKVAEVLAMYDNDREKAVWHFLNGST
ncbi:hypothetical protein QJS10_CPB22g00069 [Acorus calamus]|uniref:UBA domain-containing protein n=1 Tax=Acorus calamus TaxID=4465 RepID=A0AAV9BZX8_ACOCL|nr:hypothetical protein QJS10_CPB22g00069 [Acorus calamus]